MFRWQFSCVTAMIKCIICALSWNKCISRVKNTTVSNLMWQCCIWHFSLDFLVDTNNNMCTLKIVTWWWIKVKIHSVILKWILVSLHIKSNSSSQIQMVGGNWWRIFKTWLCWEPPRIKPNAFQLWVVFVVWWLLSLCAQEFGIVDNEDYDEDKRIMSLTYRTRKEAEIVSWNVDLFICTFVHSFISFIAFLYVFVCSWEQVWCSSGISQLPSGCPGRVHGFACDCGWLCSGLPCLPKTILLLLLFC